MRAPRRPTTISPSTPGKDLAGYKVPRRIWLVDEVHRLATAKADYGWARKYATDHPEEALCAPRSATSSA